MEDSVMVRVECLFCAGKYFFEDNPEAPVSEDAKPGDVIVARCPLCEQGNEAVLLKTERG